MTTASVEGRWPTTANVSVSAASDATPEPDMFDPSGWAEFPQPFPAAPFEHGQAATEPSPKQNEEIGGTAAVTRMSSQRKITP